MLLLLQLQLQLPGLQAGSLERTLSRQLQPANVLPQTVRGPDLQAPKGMNVWGQDTQSEASGMSFGHSPAGCQVLCYIWDVPAVSAICTMQKGSCLLQHQLSNGGQM